MAERKDRKISIFRVKYQVHPTRTTDWLVNVAGYDMDDVEKFLSKFHKRPIVITEFGVISKVDALTDTVVDNIVQQVTPVLEAIKRGNVFVCEKCKKEFDSQRGLSLHQERWCEVINAERAEKEKEKEK